MSKVNKITALRNLVVAVVGVAVTFGVLDPGTAQTVVAVVVASVAALLPTS